MVPSALRRGASPRALGFVLAAAAGMTVANLYYNQPLLGLMAAAFGATPRMVGFVATATQLGYGLAMLLLVPLGDRYERRGLIVGMTAASAFALVGVMFAPSLPALLAMSLVLGVTSMVPQYIVPFAAGLAGPGGRGAAVGSVMSGVLVGILASRTLAGFVGARLGWRAMYGVASGLMVILAVVLAAMLPEQRPETTMPLRALYRSLVDLVREHPTLRRHALLGALTFAAFSAFWTTLTFHLAALPGHYGSEVAGSFGLVGVVGALAAPIVGRVADRATPLAVNGLAIATLMLGFGVFAVFPASLVGLGVGVVLLDFGAQANHISNQTRVFNLDPARRSRLNTVYMSTYFAGGAIGSALGTTVQGRWGWAGVSVLGVGLGAAALLVLLHGELRDRRSSARGIGPAAPRRSTLQGTVRASWRIAGTLSTGSPSATTARRRNSISSSTRSPSASTTRAAWTSAARRLRASRRRSRMLARCASLSIAAKLRSMCPSSTSTILPSSCPAVPLMTWPRNVARSSALTSPSL